MEDPNLPGRKKAFVDPRTKAIHLKITEADDAELRRRVSVCRTEGDRQANRASITYTLLLQQLNVAEPKDAVVRLSCGQVEALLACLPVVWSEDPEISEVVRILRSALTALKPSTLTAQKKG